MGDSDLQSTIPRQNNDHAENISTLFYILAQFTFTKRKSELDYYHQGECASYFKSCPTT